MAELVQLSDLPDQIEFACPRCGQSCKTYPKTRAVVHAIPECRLWHEMKGKPEALAVFLIQGGVPISIGTNQ
jgi:hypothetical protein